MEQVYQLLNQVTRELSGNGGATVKDTSSFISLGYKVLADAMETEKFYNKLSDVIGLTIARAMQLADQEDMDIIKTTSQFGDITRIIKVKTIGRAEKNNSWNQGTGGSFEQVNPFTVKLADDTDIVVKYYKARGTFEAPAKVIYDYQLETAFKNEAEMSAFVNLIFVDQRNALILAKADLNKLTVATGIACALDDEEVAVHPATHRNLLAEYNTLTNQSLTVAACMRDAGFLKYAAEEMIQCAKKMQDTYPTKLYNSQGFETCICGDFAVRVHTDFATAIKVNLQSDTYHKDLVELPKYKEIVGWQSNDGTFADTSKINIENGATDTADAIKVEQGGVIAYMFDTWRHGVSYDRTRTKSIYNPASECTTFFSKCDWGSYIDSSYSGVVFYIA